MRYSSVSSTGAAITAALLSSTVLAGPVDLASVPRDAQVVIHVDLEQCLASPIFGGLLREAAEDSGESGLGLDLGADGPFGELGIDPLEAILDITVVAFDAEAGDGVVRLRTTDAIDAAIEQMTESGEISFTRAEAGWSVASVPGEGAIAIRETGLARREVWLGETRSRIESATTKGTGFAGEAPARGTLVYAAANDLMGLIDGDELPPGLNAVRSAVMSISEDDDAVSLDLGVRMSDEGPAATIAQAIAGGLAFVQLAEPEMAELARAIRISQTGDRLTLTLRASGQMLETMMDSQFGGRTAARGEDAGEEAGDESGEPMVEVRARMAALEGVVVELQDQIEQLRGSDVPAGVIRALESALDEVRAELRLLRDAGGRAGRDRSHVFHA